VMSESVIISTIGGLLGVAVAMLTLQFSGLALGAEGVMIAFQPSVSIALTGAVLAMTVGFIAGIVPGWQAARADIVTALRFA
jgi:putative ABC transport system permease protein